MVVWAIVVSRCPPAGEGSRNPATTVAVDLEKGRPEGFSKELISCSGQAVPFHEEKKKSVEFPREVICIAPAPTRRGGAASHYPKAAIGQKPGTPMALHRQANPRHSAALCRTVRRD